MTIFKLSNNGVGMREKSMALRRELLERELEGFRSARAVARPERGWLRTVREAAGISAGELGRKLGVSRQLPLQFEKAEAEDSITLKSLRNVAAALDCDLVYALVPRTGGRQETAEKRDHAPAREAKRSIEQRPRRKLRSRRAKPGRVFQ